MNSRVTCPVCGSGRVTPFLRIQGAPVFSENLWHTRASALGAPMASICLGFCHDCEHTFNVEFDRRLLEYGLQYDSSLDCSPLFRDYADGLADMLVERYQLRGRSIVEIGCGRGDFLTRLCRRGGNRGLGFDPGYPGDDGDGLSLDVPVRIRREPYRASAVDLDADFICSRQTLEHIAEPRALLGSVRNCAKTGTPVFFEVPNVLYTLRDGGVWDLIYEHFSYFSTASLARLFTESGYESIEVVETFSGQFLTIHARTAAKAPQDRPPPCPGLEKLVVSFADMYREKINQWARRLNSFDRQGRRVVVWGAGAKGTTFLNLLRPANVQYVVDINPRKQGKYLAGTGQQIVAPEFLREQRPDVIVCMNSRYRDEIARQVRGLGIEAALLAA